MDLEYVFLNVFWPTKWKGKKIYFVEMPVDWMEIFGTFFSVWDSFSNYAAHGSTPFEESMLSQEISLLGLE